MKVLSFGEILWDIYSDKKCIGGAPLNFAAHFAMCGGKAYINSAVGNDALGDATLEIVEKSGVDCRYIFRNEKPTGKCLVTLDENFVPSYNLLNDVAYDYIDVPDISDVDVLYFGTLALRSGYNMNNIKSIIKNNRFSEIFVDVNVRKPFVSEEAIGVAFSNATILKISDEELSFAAALAGVEDINTLSDIEKIPRKFGNLKLVILTMGALGAAVYDVKTDTLIKCPAEKVDVVSTVGAGDSFSAAFLARYLKKESILDCLKFASKVSGFVVSKKEAIPKYNPSIFGEGL